MGTDANSQRRLAIGAVCGGLFLVVAVPAGATGDSRLALSDVDTPKPGHSFNGGLSAPQNSIIGDSLAEPETDEPVDDTLETDVDEPGEPPAETRNVTVGYDVSLLPAPVRRMRELIIEAALKGDIEGLRPLLGTGPTRTELSVTGFDGDPIDFLRDMSGDSEGHETLAILLDILQAGYAHVDPGEPSELYLWPYFYSVPLDGLDDRQKVELFRIITAGDYEDMKDYGGYIFYRTAIDPDGHWKFLVAGD